MVKDRGALRAAVLGVAESDWSEQLNDHSDSKPAANPNQEHVLTAEVAACPADGLQLWPGGEQPWGRAPGQDVS